jgi:phosphatidate cytidylyltransferase
VADSKANGLAVRILSALVLLPVAVGAIYFGGWAFTIMVLIAAVLMVHEWNVLCGGKGFGFSSIVGMASVVGAGLLIVELPMTYVAATVGAGAALAWLASSWSGLKGGWAAAGVVYVAAPCLSLLWLRADEDSGRWLVLLLFCVIWATDMGAYAAGRTIGGPRLAPRISPKKTWAGLLGGVFLAVLSGIALTAAGGFMPLWAAGLLGAVAAVLAQLGDLGESLVKRHFDAKDSGNLIPGHGGILDRVDGLVLTAPALAILIAVMGRNLGAAQ